MVMKGAWKTLESILAGTIIMLFVAALGTTSMRLSSPVPVHGYMALQSLYEKGDLRSLAVGMNHTGIDGLVDGTGYIIGYNHSVVVCDSSGYCAGSAPDNEDVWASSMILAGDDSYAPVEVTLYIFRG